ncbi:MAG: hypothetical protein J6M62_10385 [Selenomonadaceae bacterium]|nr:hypothetical protein [Selenomonadaceae bacterium]
MATVNSTTYAAQAAGKMAVSAGIMNTSLKVISGDYTAASAASGTIINLCKLPENAVIHDVVLDTGALGASSTIKVGDSNDDDRYIAAASTASATTLRAGVTGKGYRVGTNAGDNLLIATTGGAAITGKVHFTVVYA